MTKAQIEVLIASIADGARNRANKVRSTLNEILNYSDNPQDNIKYINFLSDLPTAVSNDITLENDVTYFFTTTIDLLGSRLVSGINTTILGASSENCRITSTGLTAGVALLQSNYTTVIRHITFQDVDTCLDFDGSGNTMALDWTGVNFENIPNIGTIQNFDNFIFTKGAFLGSANLIFDGTAETIAFNQSLFIGTGSSENIIEVAATAVISRRFRIIYSSFVAFDSSTALDVNVGITIPSEGYILDTVNFSGNGAYLAGLDDTSNKSLFVNCVGIINTFVNGQMYMNANAVATTISNTVDFFKISGITTPSSDNSKYAHSNNRLTNQAVIERKYLISCSLSFQSSANNICEFGFYDSKILDVRTPSRTKSTANAGGRAENINLSCVVNHSDGDYIEVWAKNNTGANDITVTDMNVVITQI